MTTTITRTSDSATTVPTLVLGYATTREGRNVIHDLIGGDIAVTLVPPRPRAGTLRLFYLTEAEAYAALQLHAEATTFSLVTDDLVHIDMTYVLAGNVGVQLDDETRVQWVTEVDYQEVSP